MREEERQPYKVLWVAGHRFPIYLEYYEEMGKSYPEYPDFEEHPEYTDEGRPFATAAQEGCPHAKPKIPGGMLTGDCGGCGWFHCEQTSFDLIGICMCDALRREPESEKEEAK